MTVECRLPEAALILAGQSLWRNPSGADSVATKIVAGRIVAAYDTSRAGQPWSYFAGFPVWLAEIVRPANAGPIVIQIQMGGTTDVVLGGSPATTYGDEVDVSAAFTTAGGSSTKYVIGTTTTPSIDMNDAVVTITATSGTFTLTYSGQTTTAIAENASAATVEAALEALSNLGPADIAVTGSAGGPYTMTFSGYSGFLSASGAGLNGGTAVVTTNLGTLNALVIADASNAFDTVVDLAGHASLDDPTDTTYYADGTHPTAAGATVIANLLGAAVDALT